MKLFKYDNFRIVISEEALILKPFKAIWDRDRSSGKNKALQELGFIYFFCDPRSDYMFISDEDIRMEKIIEQEGLSSNWKPDKVLDRAMELYKELTTTEASLLLQDTKSALEKLRLELRDIDIREEINGKRVYKINEITSAIRQIPQLLKELVEAERFIKRELEDNSKMRGQGAKKIFEDGLI